ncbi:MAG: diaminopimelate decarboxylase [Actinomycetia bacterium]|nr:diaminopimelate decarboxylase [Actinomycetes bacterium]
MPDAAGSTDDGHLTIGGCDVTELAAEFGTSLFVYDEAHLRARCREAVAAFGGGVAYATKAFLCLAMARLVHEEGMHLDVASGGELFVARQAGVPGDRIVLHGNNKSVDELAWALEEGVGRIVVDSFDELDRLEQLYAEGRGRAQIMLRITPGIVAHTHEFISTGQDDSKFGFGLRSGAAGQAVERAGSSNAVELMGIHAHIGSQVFVAESFAKAAEALAPFVAPLGLPEVSLGGGLGVAYVEGESAPTITEWAEYVIGAARNAGMTGTIVAEPGRSIAAAAGITLYRVGTVKDLPGIRRYVAVDGGYGDNPRPVLYGSDYTSFDPARVDAARPERARLVGKHCESGDVIVRDAPIPAGLAVGDLLATPVTGAYGHGMGSNYNKMLRPAVVFAADGDARLVVRRETHEDLIRHDCP